jgi:hypothetical protein
LVAEILSLERPLTPEKKKIGKLMAIWPSKEKKK